MAWEDRTPFAAIKVQFGLSEAEVIKIMRQNLNPKSFRNWRQRVNGRKTKSTSTQLTGYRHRCPTQGKRRPKPRK
ncbi:MAG: TIGR03643 family protein [Pseudobacteriovorax sp.]|nr:TIGR03643 family protein [Pseudobacteriovorax sp.]